MTQATGISKAQRREYARGDLIGGKYGLVRLLGEGGMGSVWVAENMSLGANVALKLIRADVAEASANERFLSEARLAARLQHSAIVRVFDFGKTEQDEPYIVMELLEGETLGQRLSHLGAIDPTELVQTLLPIIDALHSAHGHGVIHRDLKPDNVFIAKSEGGGIQPKLLDFGIAKLRGEGAFQTTKLTQAGTLIGSPDYMSPEQARGETDLDPRSDVWALCVLIYECLVGKPPFHGDNYNALLWSIIHDEPVPITVFQAGDAELWRVLKTGFAKDRNARWESARKLGEALAAWLESHGVLEDVCNRSLQSSWLPAERPTRPELTPFDPHGPGLPHRRSPNGSLVPPPTLAALRRPHTMSLWFAGLGLLTLVGALFLSKTETGSASPSVDAAASGRQKVGALLPGPAPESREAAGAAASKGSNLPLVELPSGASPRALERSNGGAPEPGRAPSPTAGTAAPSPLAAPSALEQRAADEPIGAAPPAADADPGGWKANHAAHPHARSLADDVKKGMSGSRGNPTDPSHAATASESAAAGKSSSADPSADKRHPAKAAPRPAADASKPKPARSATKKAGEAKPAADTEVDFGI